jgi:carbamoyl-phosphate synthase large subunit
VTLEKPQKVLIIGSGPIVIGQAAEFDYAGTQACKAMREEGVMSILVNSNPATIMTDQGVADRVYIEPLTAEVIAKIIEKERPDGLLPTLGGQTGLNLAVELADSGVLDRFNVRLLGTPLETIRQAEDRELFKSLLLSIGEPVLPGRTVTSLEEAHQVRDEFGLPLVVRPAYTLGGTGGGIAETDEQFDRITRGGLEASPIHQVLLERSLVGWKEVEYEVMRDGADACITICNMENFDPMGVHTGDSIVVAPSQTLSDRDYQTLRSASLKIIRALSIEGGCNIQFSLGPRPDVTPWDTTGAGTALPYYVIEVNPRVSRSSALASKATGYPIARVAAKIALGRRLEEIPNAVTMKTTAAFEPALDYVVVKIPRWPFDKFPFGDRTLGTQMKATGEVMAIDRSFEGALQKAVRSLEIGGRSLRWEDARWRDSIPDTALKPSDERLWALMACLRRGVSALDLSRRTGVDPWFTRKLANIVDMEQVLLTERLTPDLLRRAKRMGFSDREIGTLADSLPERVREQRLAWGIRPVYKMVDTCAGEFDAQTAYFYSTYEEENETQPFDGPRLLVIGSGPIRIGQGIEFDYCSVQAARALRHAGYRAIMANSNPETVSTDFDTSDRLYFEPLDEEAVRDILDNETVDDEAPASIVQFGGQTAINLALPLTRAGASIAGSSAEVIDIAEDRRRFEDFLQRTGVPQPPGAAVTNVEDGLRTADLIGYPVLVRPSYVLGGRAMEIVQSANELVRYMRAAVDMSEGRPILIDKYLEGREIEVDAICDGDQVLIPGIMEHIERAGVHSGDSMAVYPGISLSAREIETIVTYTEQIALGLGARGLLNIQFVVKPGSATAPSSRGLGAATSDGALGIYVIEVNPRGSRTVPFLSKVTGIPMVELAVNVMLGRSLAEQGYPGGLWPSQDLVAVKVPVFSMSKLVGVDTYLGPEMKSTGEAMGIGRDFPTALAKGLMSSELKLKREGTALLSIGPRKAEAIPIVRGLAAAGYTFYATEGTAEFIRALGHQVFDVFKLNEGHPDILDIIGEGKVSCIVNTPTGIVTQTMLDGFYIRRAAAERRIPCFTSLDTAKAAVDALRIDEAALEVHPLSHYVQTAKPGATLSAQRTQS